MNEPNTIKLVYIAGPYRASTPWGIEQNIRRAEYIGLQIAQLGYTPVIPHTMYRFFQDSLPDSFWLAATMDLLMQCDAILMLRNSEQSAGAVVELEAAAAKGLACWSQTALDRNEIPACVAGQQHTEQQS